MVKKYHMTWYLHITTKKTNSPTPGCSRQATIIKNHIVKMIYLKKLSKLCLQRVHLDRLCLSESSEVVQRPRDGVLIHTFPLCGVCVVSLTHNIGIPLKDVLTSGNVLQNWNTLQCNIMGLYSDTEALKDWN